MFKVNNKGSRTTSMTFLLLTLVVNFVHLFFIALLSVDRHKYMNSLSTKYRSLR